VVSRTQWTIGKNFSTWENTGGSLACAGMHHS